MSNPKAPGNWIESPLIIIGLIVLGILLRNQVPIWIPAIAIAIILLNKSSKKAGEKMKKKAAIQRFNAEQFNSFGPTPEERQKNIEKFFEAKEGSLSFATWWDFNGWNGQRNVTSSLTFRISRHLATMEDKDQLFLKYALLLYNLGKITASNYNYYLLAFINGNGKASIEDWNYHNSHESFKDGPGVVKFYVDKSDASVDSAINGLLKIIPPEWGWGGGGGGGGRVWLNKDDIPNSIFNGSGKYRLQLGLLDGDNLTYGGEGSLITIAPPGSGKTQCFVLPNMLTWTEAAVVLDVGGGIYEATHKWRSENVGPVYKFSPLDPVNSNSYNPLTFIREHPDYIWSDSRLLADMMIVPSAPGGDKFWEESARDLLQASIAHICFNNDPPDRTMRKVMSILSGKDLGEMIISLKSNALVAPMEDAGYSLSTMEKKTMEGILQTARASLSAWQEPLVSKVTQKSDWNPLDLLKNKPTIYICATADKMDALLSIFRVFIAQHIQMLFYKFEAGDRSAKIPVLFMLDEFPKLKNMPPVDMALNVGAGYGIRLWMFAQSYGQLKESYPNAEGMMGSCAVRTFMNVPLQDELATKLCDQLGYGGMRLNGSGPEPVLTPRELAGEKYKDIALIISTGTKPARVQKAFLWKNEELKSRIG